MKKAFKILILFYSIIFITGCSTAYKSEPDKQFYFITITDVGSGVKDITAKSGYFDSASAGGIVAIGSQLGFSPSAVLLTALLSGSAGNTITGMKPDEVFVTMSTSKGDGFKSYKRGRVKFNPEMILWQKDDLIKEYRNENGELSLQLADREISAKRKAILDSLGRNQARN